MDRRTLMMGAGAGFIGLGAYQLLRPQGGEVPLLPMGAASAQESGPAPEVIEMVKGRPDAPVEMIEYASFTCPHCKTFHENVMPRLEADYIDPGHVRFVYREVYFDRFALWAGMVARCAGPDQYFGMVDLIYADQGSWTQGGPAEIAENLRRIGRTAGLGSDEVDACLTDAAMAQAMIETYEANIEEHDISGTPSFVIDGRIYSNMSYDDLREILDDRIEAAG